MRVGEGTGLQPIVVRSMLPVASGLFVLPDAGIKPSQFLALSKTVAQVSAIQRVSVKADLHDKLFAAREGLAAIAAGESQPDQVARAAEAFNTYMDSLDQGNVVERTKAAEMRAALETVEADLARAGVAVVDGRLRPDADRLLRNVEFEPEVVSESFAMARERLEPVFVRQSESLSVEQETAQARIPLTHSAAAVGAALAGLTLKSARITSILGRMDSATRASTSQGARLRRLAALTMPRPMMPGTILPGFPALGRPTGYRDGAEYEMARRTPGLAPGKAVVSAARPDGVPAFEKPRPAEILPPVADPTAPPGQSSEVAKVVREIERVRREKPVSDKVRLPEPSTNRRLDDQGQPVSAFRKLRPAVRPERTKPSEPNIPGPAPVERPEKGRNVPELPEVTQDSRPVQKPDKIPKNPGQALKDLLPRNPLPPGQQPLEPGRTQGPALPAPPK